LDDLPEGTIRQTAATATANALGSSFDGGCRSAIASFDKDQRSSTFTAERLILAKALMRERLYCERY
jgi:hypothetical protein